MSGSDEGMQFGGAPGRCPAYDPNNLDPLDEEARKYDDTSEGIDWDEIIASTQDDVEAGRFAFDSSHYASDEVAMDAFWKFLVSIAEEVDRESTSAPPVHTTSAKRSQSEHSIHSSATVGETARSVAGHL